MTGPSPAPSSGGTPSSGNTHFSGSIVPHGPTGSHAEKFPDHLPAPHGWEFSAVELLVLMDIFWCSLQFMIDRINVCMYVCIYIYVLLKRVYIVYYMSTVGVFICAHEFLDVCKKCCLY